MPSLFMFTPPKNTDSNTELTLDESQQEEHAREFRSESAGSAVCLVEECVDVSRQADFVDVCLTEEICQEEKEETLIKIREAGHDVDIIKDCVSELTEKSLQRKLRDEERNLKFKNVLSSKDNANTLLCESEDMVFQCDWNEGEIKPCHFFWFAKRDARNMTPREGTVCSRLQQWTPADRDREKDRVEAAECALRITMDGVCFFLG